MAHNKSKSPRIEAILKMIERKRKAFFAALPSTHSCRTCDKRKHKDKFGARLMNGPEVVANDAEPIFRIQSSCTSCRG